MADKATKVAVGMSTAAAITAALAYANTKTAQASGNGLSPELVNLLAVIAASSNSIDDSIIDIINEITKLAINVQGWPPNVNSITALRVGVGVAGTQMPYIAVPDGMTLFIKAWGLNPGWLQVGSSLSACVSINQSFPLIPNETVWYAVQNAENIWIAGTVAGCFACLTVERRKGGG